MLENMEEGFVGCFFFKIPLSGCLSGLPEPPPLSAVRRLVLGTGGPPLGFYVGQRTVGTRAECVRGVSDASEIPARRKRERRKIRAATTGRRAEEDEEKADTWAATTTG